MAKKLKIRFVKFEKALAMQILEQVGEFKNSEHVRAVAVPELAVDTVYLRVANGLSYLRISSRCFDTNAARDECLNKVVQWITDEQFSNGAGELKVGEMCEVRDCETENWTQRKLLAVLPEDCNPRYITAVSRWILDKGWIEWKSARPLVQRIEPKIDGDVYTWEM